MQSKTLVANKTIKLQNVRETGKGQEQHYRKSEVMENKKNNGTLIIKQHYEAIVFFKKFSFSFIYLLCEIQ